MDIRKHSALYDWLDQRLNITALKKIMVSEYWIPKKINFLWSFGLILAALFGILTVTGFFLLMYYKPDTALAFNSVNHTIMQEVAYGWIFRHTHAVAASVIFLAIYIHMFTGIYYGSYKKGREVIWITGIILFGAFAAEAFSGYMLPWGQMSYWAAQVITDIFGSIPFFGPDLVVWIRGDYVVSDPTLTRFFALHVVILPLIIIAVIAAHFYALRIPHVNSEDAEDIDFDEEARKFKAGEMKSAKVIPFWPTFVSEDIFVLGVFLTFFFYLVFFHFSFAMDPVNFIPANTMKTPPHIYPEWYFLWSYEVLRGFFFSGQMGLAAFGLANTVFLFMPWLDRHADVVRPASKRPLFKFWFWLTILDLIGLTILGKLPPIGINAYIGFFFAASFLLLMLVVLPLLTIIERKRYDRGLSDA